MIRERELRQIAGRTGLGFILRRPAPGGSHTWAGGDPGREDAHHPSARRGTGLLRRLEAAEGDLTRRSRPDLRSER